MNAIRDFVSEERREFKVRIGRHVASSLSGFVAGAAVVSIVWALVEYFGQF